MAATALPNTADIRARLKNSFASRLITDVIRRSKAKRYHITAASYQFPPDSRHSANHPFQP
jgi:hypothetical protein